MPATFWVIIFVPFVLLFLLLFFITLNRYITYKERVALARLGYAPEEISQSLAKRPGNRGVLWGGVITGMSGLALLLGLSTLGIGAWLLAGLLPLFVGLGMVVVYFITLGPPVGGTSSQEAPSSEPIVADNKGAQPEKVRHPAGNSER
ncbi:MAG: hypothetical protein H5T69_14140 [Chloroflexi bacterium]|nr:hypothetical protein [Chloroflexota bacterium]